HDSIPIGAYIGSNPGIGSSITPGSILTITISKGPAGGSTTPPVNNNPTTPEDIPDNGSSEGSED
ncbi:MAG: hypothetical protein PUC22_03150, partial [Turicibacter sp.]|nr:hypothetical protein [Turicibacter sp.]